MTSRPDTSFAALLDRWHERPVRSGGWRLLITVAILGDLAALAGLVGHYLASGEMYLVACAAFSPYLGLGAVVAAILHGIARGRTGWLGLALSVGLVVWFAVLQVPLFVAQPVPPGQDVTVMTANLWLGRGQPRAVVDAVRRDHVQVLVLEELTPQAFAGMHAAGLDELMPYRVVAPDKTGVGTGLWSTRPLAGSSVGNDLGYNSVTAQLRVGARTLSVLGVHLYGPYPSSETPHWLRDMQLLPGVMAGLPDGPALVVGDFNATPDVAQFRELLQHGFADAADQAGAGFTPTYPADRGIPLITIDHVLTRAAVAHRVDSVLIPDSDHRALVVTVRLPG